MPNLSLFAIPAHWSLSIAPQVYSVVMMKKANNGRWNNANPHSSDWEASLRKSVQAETYSRYERAQAAHKNGMENLALFSAAILAGNLARLSPSVLNAFAASHLILRGIYNIIYINVTTNKKSFARSGVWIVSVLLSLGVLVQSAIELA